MNQIEPKFGWREATAISKYIMSDGWGTEHKYTEEFEDIIADYVGARYCSAVNNGTVGLILALLSLGLQGKRVAVPAMTMIATANAVRFIGAEPVFIDVDETGCIDIDQTLEAKPDAVIYVSLNGRMGDIERLKGIPVIEDACQSLGAMYRGTHIGTFGKVGVYSLSPHKIISTGQGGLVVTDDIEIHKNIERLKDFGRLEGGRDHHEYFGINSKFTDFQAVIGIEQAKDLDRRLKRKRQIFDLYYKHIRYGYTIEHNSFPWMVDWYGIGQEFDFPTRKMYGVVPHQPIYDIDKRFPVAQKMSKGIWLPSSITLKNSDIKEICEEINDCCRRAMLQTR